DCKLLIDRPIEFNNKSAISNSHLAIPLTSRRLIQNAVDEPRVRRAVAEEAIDPPIAQRDVPLVPIPRSPAVRPSSRPSPSYLFSSVSPPVPGRPPRACTRAHAAA